MRIKMGTSVPKMGTTVHLDADQAAYRKAIADTLRRGSCLGSGGNLKAA